MLGNVLLTLVKLTHSGPIVPYLGLAETISALDLEGLLQVTVVARGGLSHEIRATGRGTHVDIDSLGLRQVSCAISIVFSWTDSLLNPSLPFLSNGEPLGVGFPVVHVVVGAWFSSTILWPSERSFTPR